MERCSCCSRLVESIDLRRCTHEECGDLLCSEECIVYHMQTEHPELKTKEIMGLFGGVHKVPADWQIVVALPSESPKTPVCAALRTIVYEDRSATINNQMAAEFFKEVEDLIKDSEPIARSCWDPECEGCWGCSDLSEKEFILA